MFGLGTFAEFSFASDTKTIPAGNWTIINNSQSTSWSNINNSQSNTWTSVNNAQSAGWSNVINT